MVVYEKSKKLLKRTTYAYTKYYRNGQSIIIQSNAEKDNS